MNSIKYLKQPNYFNVPDKLSNKFKTPILNTQSDTKINDSTEPPHLKYNISLLSIFKNETMNLKIFIEHYLWQGVDHFYLIDNNSTDNPLDILQPYIDKGIITYKKYDQPYVQVKHYRRIYKNCDIRKSSRWLIVADLDEFWFVPDGKISTYLNRNHNYIIHSNWKMFGSDGLLDHPEDIRTAITHRKPELRGETKWIIKCRKFYSENIGMHSVKIGHIKNKNKIITDNIGIQLNHYPIQSKEFFDKVKKPRGDAANQKSNNVRNDDYFQLYDSNTTTTDTILRDMILNVHHLEPIVNL